MTKENSDIRRDVREIAESDWHPTIPTKKEISNQCGGNPYVDNVRLYTNRIAVKSDDRTIADKVNRVGRNLAGVIYTAFKKR